MRVGVYPPFRGSAQRYGELLYEACSDRDHDLEVLELAMRRPFKKVDLVHLHWPESRANRALGGAMLRVLQFHIVLRVLRLRGAKVVWTVHNVTSHDRRHPRLERLHVKALSRITDGIFVLHEESRNDVIRRYPLLERVPWKTVPIGPYPPVREPSPPPGDMANPRLLFFGSIRPYKGLEDLIVAAASCKVRLRVLGSMRSMDAMDGNVPVEHIDPGSSLQGYSEEELHAAAADSDLAVFPFRAMSNSSSVVHALSLGLPVVGPDAPALRELQGVVGRDWIYLYKDHRFCAATLEAVLEWYRSERDVRKPLDLNPLSWTHAAERTLILYRRVTAQAPSP